MNTKLIKTYLIFSLIATSLSALTEKEVVLLALKKSPAINISRINLQKDSLSLKSTKSDAELKASLTGTNILELHPATSIKALDEANNLLNSDTTALNTNLGGTISRSIPGGGIGL